MPAARSHDDEQDRLDDRLRLSLHHDVKGNGDAPGIFFAIVDHRGNDRLWGVGAALLVKEEWLDGWHLPTRRSCFELLARGNARGLIFCGWREQRVVAKDADPQVVAVDRLQAVPQGVNALGDRLIAVVMSFGCELENAD